MSRLEELVNEIITHPKFIDTVQMLVPGTSLGNSIQNAGQFPSTSASPSPSSQNLMQIQMPETSGTITPIQNRLNSQNVTDEIRRLFPSIRSQQCKELSKTSSQKRSRKRNYSEANSTFQRDVILVDNPSIENTLSGRQKSYAYEQGRIVSAITFSRNWQIDEIKNHIHSFFCEKFSNLINDFEILLPISGRLVKPNLSPGTTLDGQTLCNLFKQRPVYIRPTILPASADEVNKNNNVLEEEIATEDFNDLSTSNFFDNQFNHTDNDMNDNDDFQLESDIKLALANSLIDEKFQTICDIIKMLQKKIIPEKKSIINVYREEIFLSCLRGIRRKHFSPYHVLDVKFSDVDGSSEGAIDNGGPTRELFRLLLKYLEDSNLFVGPRHNKIITLRTEAVNKKYYYEAGRIIALSVLHCGMGPRFFSKKLYSYIVNGKAQPTLEDIEDDEVKEELEKIMKTSNLNDLQTITSKSSFLGLAGITTYVNDIEKKNQIVEDAISFFVIHRVRAAFDQLVEGLETCDILETMKKYPNHFESIFCFEESILTYKIFNDLFEIELSPEGSNHRQIENKIIAYWRDYLIDCSENDSNEGVTLSDILCFFTGINYIPPQGFDKAPKLQFLHIDTCPYPKANTCSLELSLPIHDTYENFIYHMNYGIRNGMVFGFS